MCKQCNHHEMELELIPELEAELYRYASNEFEANPVKAPAGINGAKTVASMVDPKKVSCANYDKSLPVFKAMRTTDPVGALDKIAKRAVEMLDSTISELTRVQARVTAGDPIGWPLMGDTFAMSLAKRMRIKINDRAAWRNNGPGGVGLVIRWLSNIRKIIAGGHIWYTCLSSECSADDWAWVWNSQNAENIKQKKNFYRIHLCRLFWQAKTGVSAKDHFEFQAQTIIHEASHIYYNTSDKRGTGAGIAECVAQFVAEANNSPIDPAFIKRCGGKIP